MSHENPFLYIGGLVAVLLVGYALLAAGLDMGLVVMVIIVMIILGIAGNVILQRYKRMGKHAFYNKMIKGMDPTLPLPYPELADQVEQTIHPYHMQQPFNQYDEAVFGGALPQQMRPDNYQDYMTGSAIGSRTVHEEIAGPAIHGTLAQGAPQPVYAPLPQAHPYSLHLGPNAFVDVAEAFMNALLIDPSGNIARVMAEEMAAKNVPLIFVDVAGTYKSLVAEFPLGYRIVSPQAYQAEETGSQSFAFGREQKDQALAFGHTLIQDGLQVVFDFASYTSPLEANVILWAIVQGMAQWQRRQFQLTEKHLPSLVIITEPYRLCPDDNRHSILKDNPELAESVHRNILIGLTQQNELGMYWYLASRKITGIDPEALRACRLWMIERPSPAEVRAGWFTVYTALEPETFVNVPHGYALILDRTGRNPQIVRIRRSHSEPSAVDGNMPGASTFLLPPLPALTDMPRDGENSQNFPRR